MSRAIKQTQVILPEVQLPLPARLVNMWPVIVPVLLAAALNVARLEIGPTGFLKEGALTLLALVCYISAAVILVTNLLVKENVLARFGLLSVMLGYTFNFGGWMMRWIEAGDAEGWKDGINGVWRYFPLDNLYPLSLGFCAGAAITTLVIIRKPKFRFVGALTMPIVTVVLTLAMLLGNDIRTLPPILDSYWRPIHVSIATVGYGVCLVSFGLAFAYLLKDGIRSEAIGIAVTLFGLLIYGTVGRYAIPFHMEYGSAIFWNTMQLPVRATLPWVGPLMFMTLLAILGALVAFLIYWSQNREIARDWGWKLFRGAAVLQAVVLIVLFFQVNNLEKPGATISDREYAGFAPWLGQQMSDDTRAASMDVNGAKVWVQSNMPQLRLGMKSNPVEFGGLIGLFVLLFMVSLFAWKRKEVVSAMPSLQQIDGLLYRTVGVAFPLLSLLLITGAVWANESWGRYWGWDSKEVGALVAWMAYAGFLHTRIAHNWRGRRSAYFALLGFALVIFTWLGVSYLIPGLHSYA